MLVKFTNACNPSLLEKLVCSHSITKEDQPFDLILNQSYTVYGMILIGDIMWYYLAKDTDSILIGKYPSPLFEILEGGLSKYWMFSSTKGVDGKTPRSILAFPKWANDPDFELQLKKNDIQALELFKKYKELMDLEYVDVAILGRVKEIGDTYLVCGHCSTKWYSVGIEAQVRCPKCEMLMYNPKYRPRTQKPTIPTYKFS